MNIRFVISFIDSNLMKIVAMSTLDATSFHDIFTQFLTCSNMLDQDLSNVFALSIMISQ